MLAMTVFSLVLVAAAAGLIQVGRMYYKSVIATRTQDTARSIMDEVSRSVQFSGAEPIIERDGNGQVNAFCIGNNRYSIELGSQVGDQDNPGAYGIFKDEIDAGCPTGSLSDDGAELLGENMRLTRFDIEAVPDTADQYRIVLWMVYGDDDVLQGVDAAGDFVPHDSADAVRVICRTGAISAEFCAISELSTTVSRRI